jgi:CRP-like cAMP-binding protein
MLVNSLPNENGVLVALPPSVRDRLRPSLKRVRLEAGSTLYDISSTSDHAWFITSGVLAIYERERANLGSHSAAVHRLGMHRNTLYDWLEWAREHVTK